MSLELREKTVLAYELKEVDWGQMTRSFVDHMWWPDLLLRDPALLTAPATASLDPPLFAWKLCSLPMTETVGILIESILVGGMWGSSNGKLLFKDSPSTWPKLSQNSVEV